jgi:hypothetical protein
VPSTGLGLGSRGCVGEWVGVVGRDFRIGGGNV